MDIRDKLKMYMEDHCISQASVAQKTELTPVQLSNILSKQRRLDANEMLSICKAMKITTEELLEQTDHSVSA